MNSRASRLDRAKRDLGEEPQADHAPLKPRLREWQIERILETCSGQPSDALASWLADRQVWPDDIARWNERGSVVVADWANAGKVLQSVRAILDLPHRQATFLLGMLNGLVGRHAPQNADLVPLVPPGAYEPSAPAPELPPVPKVKPRHLPDDVAALVYARAGVRNPRHTPKEHA